MNASLALVIWRCALSAVLTHTGAHFYICAHIQVCRLADRHFRHTVCLPPANRESHTPTQARTRNSNCTCYTHASMQTHTAILYTYIYVYTYVLESDSFALWSRFALSLCFAPPRSAAAHLPRFGVRSHTRSVARLFCWLCSPFSFRPPRLLDG